MRRGKADADDEFTTLSLPGTSKALKGKIKQAASSRQAQEVLQQQRQLAASSATSTVVSHPVAGSAFTQAFESLSLSGLLPSVDNQSSPLGSDSASTTPPPVLLSSRLRDTYETEDTAVNFCIKKLQKRDPITKLKALEELNQLLITRSTTELITILPAYFHVYEKLAVDNDRRVREGVYSSLTLLIQQTQKHCTPYFKSIFPIWFIQQHDTVKEVARAATTAFNTVFPTTKKQHDVLKYTAQECLTYIQTLLSSTIQSLSDMTVYTLEQATEKYERMVASALLALAAFIEHTNTTTTTNNTAAEAVTSAATGSPNYTACIDTALPLCSSKHSLIRRSCYGLLITITQHCSDYVSAHLSTLSLLVFDCIHDRDTHNHVMMWDLLLGYLQSFPTAVNYVKSKQWDKLIQMINAAGYGSSALLYHNLLPLLACLASSSAISTSAPLHTMQFYHSFFTALLSSRSQLGTGQAGIYVANIDLSAYYTSCFECCLFAIVKHKDTHPAISQDVLYEVLLPFISQQLIGDSKHAADDIRFKLAGKHLAIIERHITTATAAKPPASFSTAASASSESSSFYSASTFYFHLSELCQIALEKADRHSLEEKAQQNEQEGQSSTERVTDDIWKAVEELLCAMQEERQAAQQRKKDKEAAATAVASKTQAESASSVSASLPSPSTDPLLAVVNTVFTHALQSFIRQLTPASIHLANRLVQTFSLSAFLQSATPPIDPHSFLTSVLLPVYRSLLVCPTLSDADYSIIADAFVSLMNAAMTDAAMKTPSLPTELQQTLNEILTLLLSSTPFVAAQPQQPAAQTSTASSSSSNPTTALSKHLIFFQSFLSTVILSIPHYMSHSILDDEALHLAESLLTNTDTHLRTYYISIFQALLPLLSKSTSTAIIDSFVDALSSFLNVSGVFQQQLLDSYTEYEKQSGASVGTLPSLLAILTPLLSTPTALQATVEPTEHRDRVRSALLRIFFFLQLHPTRGIAHEARNAWQSVQWNETDHTATDCLTGLAAVFRHALLNDDIHSLTSTWILNWVEQAKTLLLHIRDEDLQQSILTALLPQHTDIQALLPQTQADHAERLRVIRDCLNELIAILGVKLVILHPNNLRGWLLVDLMAIEHYLRWFTKHSAVIDNGKHQADHKSNDSATVVSSMLLTFSTDLSSGVYAPAFLQSLLMISLTESEACGHVYSDTLRFLGQQLKGQPISILSSAPAVLFTQQILLPLSNRSSSSILPSSLSSLLQPLTLALHTTLTVSMTETIEAFLDPTSLFGAAQSSAADAELSPQLAVLLRALLAEGERLVDKGMKDDQDILYLGLLTTSVAAVLHSLAKTPVWLCDRVMSWFSSLPAVVTKSSSSSSDAITRYLYGKSRLMQLMWIWLIHPNSSTVIRTTAIAQATTIPSTSVSMVKKMVLAITQALSFSLTQSRSDTGAPSTHTTTATNTFSLFPSFFLYLQPTCATLFTAAPLLISSSSLLSLDLLPAFTAAYRLLTSSLIQMLSITCYETMLEQLAAVVDMYMHRVPGAINSLMHTDVTQTAVITASMDIEQPAAFDPSVPMSHLFSLLAHPFPGLVLHVYSLLSSALLYRAVTIPIVIEADELEQEAAVVALSEVKKTEYEYDETTDYDDYDPFVTNSSNEQQTPPTVDNEETLRKENKRRKRRLMKEKHRLRERINLLLPSQLQHLLESKLSTTEDGVTSSTTATTTADLFAHAPLSCQLRAYLLVFGLMLDVSQHLLPLTSMSLPEDKRALLVSYVRAYDLFGANMDELIEHMIVASQTQERQAWRQDWEQHAITASSTTSIPTKPIDPPLHLSLLFPSSPVATERKVWTNTSTMHRCRYLQQMSNDAHYVDDAIFYPSLSANLYLRTLHVWPALSKGWFTNVERTASQLIHKLTQQYFSPFLLHQELHTLHAKQLFTPSPSTTPTTSTTPTPTPTPSKSAPTEAADATTELRIRVDFDAHVVYARYTHDEVQMMLILRLPAVYPLQLTSVEFSESVKISTNWIKRWQLSIAATLSSSNGSLLSAIQGWKANVDQHLQGVEACPICYNILHPINHSLPKMKCRQCHSTFHSVCLYTWFEKGQVSSCPMCRANF